MRRWHAPEGVDLVDLGDVRAFMLVEDNLYRICVPEDRRRFPLDRHYARLDAEGPQPSLVRREDLHLLTQARWALLLVLDHLLRHSSPVTILDVGAFVGDVGLRLANYARTVQPEAQTTTYCFDPSLSGELIPFNIALNQLQDSVVYCPYAVSDLDGYIAFAQQPHHSDSARAALDGGGANTIVESIRLSDFIRDNQIGTALIKLDTENLEPRILADVETFLATSVNAVGIEFHAAQGAMSERLRKMLSTHLLFDIGYLPKPFCCRPVSGERFEEFVKETAARAYAYTDVLAVSRLTPAVDVLATRLAALDDEPVG